MLHYDYDTRRVVSKYINTHALCLVCTWIINEKSRATLGRTSNASVIIGKNTDAPPSLVIPATKLANTAVTVVMYERRERE